MKFIAVGALLLVTFAVTGAQLPTFEDPFNFPSSRNNDYDKCIDTCGQRQWQATMTCFMRERHLRACRERSKVVAANCVKQQCDPVKQKIEFVSGVGNMLAIATGDVLRDGNLKDFKSLKPFGIVMAGRNSTFFKVKAAKEVYVALSSQNYNFNSETYLVYLGRGSGQQHGFCREIPATVAGFDGEGCMSFSDTPYLSSSDFQSFWITWAPTDDQHLRLALGTGDVVGENERGFVTYPSHSINYMSISTGWGATGMWKFDKEKLTQRASASCSACCGGCVIKDVPNQPPCPGSPERRTRHKLIRKQQPCGVSSTCQVTFNVPEHYYVQGEPWCCAGYVLSTENRCISEL